MASPRSHSPSSTHPRAALTLCAASAVLAVVVLAATGAAAVGSPKPYDPIHKIRHVVIVMQENRSFDSYFGTFPGARGIPIRNGAAQLCVSDPQKHLCELPFHDGRDVN